jgi:hypothetical protein
MNTETVKRLIRWSKARGLEGRLHGLSPEQIEQASRELGFPEYAILAAAIQHPPPRVRRSPGTATTLRGIEAHAVVRICRRAIHIMTVGEFATLRRALEIGDEPRPRDAVLELFLDDADRVAEISAAIARVAPGAWASAAAKLSVVGTHGRSDDQVRAACRRIFERLTIAQQLIVRSELVAGSSSSSVDALARAIDQAAPGALARELFPLP